MKQTKIEWTEQTWNPSVGCTKVSDGCKYCYAEAMAYRLKAIGIKGYENGFNFTLMPNRLEQPLSIKKPTKFFVNSMSDLFHEKMPYSYLDSIFEIINKTPWHIYQILTKREINMSNYFKNRVIPRNVWLGVTVENKKSIRRIEYLKNIDATIRFISMEPLLEELGELNLNGIHWVIVGGESGPQARPMKKEWASAIKLQCKNQRIAFFFKQWGTWNAEGVRLNKKSNGRVLDGKIWNEYPKLAPSFC